MQDVVTIPTAKTVWLWQRSYNILIIDGKYVSLTQRGQGKDLVFLHGYQSQKESFYPLMERLQNRFRCTAIDCIGFGKSGAIPYAYDVYDYAKWLKKVLTKLHIHSPHILAHSFGARVLFCLLDRGYVADHLIITGGAGIVKPKDRAYVRKVKAYRRCKKIFPKLAERIFGSEEYRTLSPVERESYKKIVNCDLSAQAEKIKNQTLLIYGREDSVTPPEEEGATFHRLIVGSQFVQMTGGHFCFMEEPDEFCRYVKEFI